MGSSRKAPLKGRILAPIAVTVFAATLAACIGYLLARAVTLRATESRLEASASGTLSRTDAFYNEEHATLNAINASPYPPCSDADVSSMRKLLLKSGFLKDAGRIRDGKIECSAILSREDLPLTRFQPQFSLRDGTKIYRNMTPYKNRESFMIIAEKEGSYVVFGGAQGYLDPGPMHFTIMLLDAPSGKAGRLGGDPVLTNGAITDKDAQGHLGDVLYATRCSAKYSECIVGYTSIPEIMQAVRTQQRVYTSLSGLIGAFTGILCLLVYRRNRSMEQQLRRAIRRDSMRVVYQPIIQLGTGRTVGAEALSRWNDENNVAVPPDVFIRLAEERGFIGQITNLVVRHALRDFGETFRKDPDFRLSINVTASDLADPQFLPMLASSLEHENVPARSITIELTESDTANSQIAIEAIRRLRENGHSVHIDDFGTGYSSLSYLHALAVDAIKIDRSFTHAIGTDAVTLSILPQILAMAEKLNLQIIVEGVETELQARFFCATAPQTLAQGWHFGRPMPAETFCALLTQQDEKPLRVGFDDCACSEDIRLVCTRRFECPHLEKDESKILVNQDPL
jgi:sensor c-di-GMP phosphodiesterase-like protein